MKIISVLLTVCAFTGTVLIVPAPFVFGESPIVQSQGTANNSEKNLFLPVDIEADPPKVGQPTIIRSRFTGINFDVLGTRTKPATSINLNLFENVNFKAFFDRKETNLSDGIGWIGHLEGIEHSQVVLVVTDGILVGSVSMPGESYEIHPAANGIHTVDQIDQSAFPPEMDPIPVPASRNEVVRDVSEPDTCDSITVLVAYSPEARIADGGTVAIEARIALAVVETNQSYVNSGLVQRLTLVHTMQTNTDEAENHFSTDLYALQNTTDGIFDNVDAARETYKADLVALIIEEPTYCGLAFLNSTADWAFSVTHRTCATGYYSFGHELGHNMGAHHDWYVNDEQNIHKGFVNVTDGWRTIMAYNSLCSDQASYCTRLQYWSNPRVYYGSDPMGVGDDGPMHCVEGSFTPDPSSCRADNRERLNSTCATIANFRIGGIVTTTPKFSPWLQPLLLSD